MKRRSVQSRKRRDRKASLAPYTKSQKVPYRYDWLEKFRADRSGKGRSK